MKDFINEIIRLQNTPHHRWSNLEELLFKILFLWQQVISTFAESGSVAPMFGMMQVLKEFWTVLSNVKICQKISQHRNEFSVLQFFFALIGLCKATFSLGCVLKIKNSFSERTVTEVLGQQQNNHSNVHCNNLQPGKLLSMLISFMHHSMPSEPMKLTNSHAHSPKIITCSHKSCD